MTRAAASLVAAAAIAVAWSFGCGSSAPPARDPSADSLADVARIHGGAGPWAVAGYRMGKYALAKLALDKQSFDLEVTHRTPHLVQYSCIADGASAATGASAGKLNLTLVDADAAHVVTTYRKRSTGQSITLRPSPSFVARFRDVPRAGLGEAGRTVMTLPDADVFEEVATPALSSPPPPEASP